MYILLLSVRAFPRSLIQRLRSTNMNGKMGDGCDLNATVVHVGVRFKGKAAMCCAECAKTPGCTGYTWDSDDGGYCYLKHVSKCNASKPLGVGQFAASATLKVVPKGADAGFKPGRCKYNK
eukprot:COSAG01_NODE_3863_length_5621_cov_2.450970_2_plen_121_part_00